MATGENQMQVSSQQAAGSKPCKEARHRNQTQQYSKEQSSSSLLLYRKLLCDSWTILDGDNRCQLSSELLGTEARLSPDLLAGKRIERNTRTVSPKPVRSSESSPCQLDGPGQGVDAGRNKGGSSHCSCNLYMGPNTYSRTSPRSSPSPDSSPSQPRQLRIRRGSLPVSMLPLHKVTKEGTAEHLICCC